MAQGLVGLAVLVLAAALPVGPGGLRLVVGTVGGYLAAVALHRWWQHRTGRKISLGIILSSLWLGGLTLAAMFVSVLPLAEGRDPSRTLTQPAMLQPNLFSRHPLGTDSQALDVLSTLLYGARVSIMVAVGAVLFALVVGGLFGVLAGYFRGWADSAIGFVTDAMLAFPALILLLAMASIMRPSPVNVTLALGILATPGIVRLARAGTLAIASREFVTAGRTLGARTSRIVFREIIPHIIPPMVAYSFIVAGFLIVAEASLSFLGLGIRRPNPTWGNLIAQGQGLLITHPWLVILPAFFLFLTVVSSNFIGQRLQQKWAI